jgi:hypothetical protein
MKTPEVSGIKTGEFPREYSGGIRSNNGDHKVPARRVFHGHAAGAAVKLAL